MIDLDLNQLITFVLSLRQSMDAQVQLWISVTFALVVVSFSAGEKLSYRLRMLVGVLYLLATSTFIARWLHDYFDMEMFLQEISSRGLEFESLMFAATIRLLLLILGTVAAMIFLFKANLVKKI